MTSTALCCLIALLPSLAFAAQKPGRGSSRSGKTVASAVGSGGTRLQRTASTPYDRYLGNVHVVIAAAKSRRASMAEVRQWMNTAYEFSYVERDRYRPDSPRTTAAIRAGDCKSKSLWLFEKLADSDALFVIGKTRRNPRANHAWVCWRNSSGWWILDSTFAREPIAMNAFSSGLYVPLYAYGKSGTYQLPAR